MRLKGFFIPVLIIVALCSCTKELVYEELDYMVKESIDLDVTLSSAGSLRALLPENYLKVSSLKINGEINGDDIALIREMAGSDFNCHKTQGCLKKLDLSDARFIEGGCPYVHISRGELYSSNDEVPDAMFVFCNQIKEIVLPENIIAIGDWAFQNCDSLANVNIPKSVSTLGKYSFYECAELLSISVPEKIKTIHEATFYGCVNLVEIKLSSQLERIENYAFYKCAKVASFGNLPNIKNIGKYAFGYCSKLEDFNIPNEIDSHCERFFFLLSKTYEYRYQ